MTIERIHQEIKFRLNKLNSNHKQDFPVEYIDDAINKVINDYVEIFYAGNTMKPYKLGFEVTQQRMDMLTTLVIPEVSVTFTNFDTDVYFSNLSTLVTPYKHFIRGYVVPEECEKKIPITITRHNDLDFKLRSANQQPSLKWERCLGVFKNNQLFIYTKDFTPDSIFIEYIKQPTKVFYGGYNSLEFINGDTAAYNTVSPKVTSDIPANYHDLLVDMVVQYLASVIEDENTYNFQREKIQSLI